MKSTLFVVLSHLCIITLANDPGFKTTLTESAVNYFGAVGVQILEQKLHTVVVPDQSGDAHTPIGQVDWWLTNIVVSNLNIGSGSITFIPNSGLSMQIQNVNVDLSANWRYRKVHWPHISDHGSADVIVGDTSFSITMAITDNNERPYLTVTSDSVNIGVLDIHLHGGASWLYDFFIGILKGKIRHSIEKSLTDAITTNIDNGVNSVLAKLPIMQPVNHEVEIDYALTGNPIFTSSYLSVPMLGEFYSISDPVECPASTCPADSLVDEVNSDMVQMVIGDYVANSAGFTFFQRGDLKLVVTNKQIPSWAPLGLNTSDWKYIIPELYLKYPGDAMILNIYATDAPSSYFTPSGANVQTNGEIDVMVQLGDGSEVLAFSLAGWVATSGKALLDDQVVYGNLTYLKGNFTLKQSNVGTIDVELLDDLLNVLFAAGVVPAVNTVLRTGFKLPTVPGITFEDSQLIGGNGYVVVATNIQYTPPL